MADTWARQAAGVIGCAKMVSCIPLFSACRLCSKKFPEYKTALLKIKRFMEDEDNLSKSSQKILKSKMELAEAVA